MAQKQNLTIYQGSTYSQEFILKNSAGVAIDLTGYSGRGQIRSTYTSATVEAEFTVSVEVPIQGRLLIELSSAQTSTIKGGRYVYDIEIVSGGAVYRVVQGNVTVYPEVTKPTSSSSSSSSS